MSSIDPNFKPEIFRKNQDLVISGNRQTAMLHPVRLRYKSGGYLSGTVLARNTTDGLYDAYANGGSSGTGVAVAVLLDGFAPEDFSGTTASDSTITRALFGGCTVYKDNLTGYHAGILTDLKATLITLADTTVLMKF